MVRKLMRSVDVTHTTTLLDPGCGEGEFIAGVLRWCERNQKPTPRVLGIEQHPARAAEARRRFKSVSRVRIETSDFLLERQDRFDLIIGNPPYVSLGHLGSDERKEYRERYLTARGRFDLYMLFFEQSLALLKPTGRLVFVTPEKFTYVDSARALRRLMIERSVRELHFVDEASFAGHVTYPVITTIGPKKTAGLTTVTLRSGESRDVRLVGDGSWQSTIHGESIRASGPTLGEVCLRVSCGVATGADSTFVLSETELDSSLRPFAHPTVSGRQLGRTAMGDSGSVILVPYDLEGRLLPESRLGALGRYLGHPKRKASLTSRTCAARKPWYAFHDSAPLADILRPKILCKDIAPRPSFVADYGGTIVPRHSTYYIVPRDPSALPKLLEYLNSPAASRWLLANCQRAANGFVRLQSGVLKRLPVPASLGGAFRPEDQLELAEEAISA